MKERLTGAIILVALMVLLVPELLTGPIRPKSAPAASATVATAPAVAAGSTEDAQPPLRSYTLTLGAGSAASGAAAAPAAQALAQPAEGSQSPLKASTQITTASPEAGSDSQHAPEAQAPAPHGEASSGSQRSTGTGADLQVSKSAAHGSAAEARSSASTGGWVVQLGSFASRRNADHLARSLEARGFRMSVSPARAGARVLWRVRVGPARDRAGAQHLAARLQALGHRGELLPAR